jgi:hypothetical protein
LDNLFKYSDEEHLVHSLGVAAISPNNVLSSEQHVVKNFLNNLRKEKERWALNFLQGHRRRYDLIAALKEKVDIAVNRGLNKRELLENFIVQQEALEAEHVMRSKLTLYKALLKQDHKIFKKEDKVIFKSLIKQWNAKNPSKKICI